MRMLETLPKRTHAWIPRGAMPIGWGEKRSPQQEEELRKELKASRAAGMTLREMCTAHHTTARLIKRLIGPCPRQR
jgi:hypothetical protein